MERNIGDESEVGHTTAVHSTALEANTRVRDSLTTVCHVFVMLTHGEQISQPHLPLSIRLMLPRVGRSNGVDSYHSMKRGSEP